MANSVKLNVKINPQLDAGEIQKKLVEIENSDLDLDVLLNSGKAESVIDELMKSTDELYSMLNEVAEVDVNTDAGLKAIEDLQDKIDGIESVDIDIGSIAAEFEKAQNEMAALEKAQRLAIASMKLAGQDGTAEYKQLTEQLGETRKVLDEMAKAASEVETPNTADWSFTDIAMAAQSATDFGDKLTSFAEKGVEVRNAMNEVSAKTGLVGVELENLKARAEDAFINGVGGSVGEAVAAMGTAQQLLGQYLKGDELQAFTEGAAAIAKVFDKDINEVLGKSRTFIANFGLDGQKAFELVGLAMQTTGSGMDDTLDTLDEYSQLMVKAGFSAEEFIGLLTTGMNKGSRDTDKLADSIKETQIRLNAGDTATALAGISAPITQKINDIVALGQQGAISVKEMMQQTSQILSESYDSGQITASIRDQFAVAISGTMAEDIGGQLWTDIFSSKIDDAAIDAQAKAAGARIKNSLGAVTVFEKVQKQIELFATKASDMLGPAVAGAGALISSLSGVAPALLLITQNWDAISSGAGKAFGYVKNVVGNSFTAIKTSFATGTVSATTFWSAATLGIALLIPALIALYEYFEPFKNLVDDLASSASSGFNLIVAYISNFASNAGEILAGFGELAKAYMNPANWFSDEGGAEIDKAKSKIAASINKALKGAQNDIDKGGLGDAITEAAQIKGDLDKNKRLQKLINDFKNAKDEASRNSIAKAIQQDVPGALSGIQQVTDANGKITTVYSVNIKKAEDFAKAQEKSLNQGLSDKQKKFRDGVIAIGSDYDNAKAKVSELQQKVVENPGDLGLRQSLADAQKELDGTAQKMAETVDEGKKLGLVSGNAKEMAAQFGFSGDKAQAVANKVTEITDRANEAAKAAKGIGKSFAEANTDAGKALGDLKTKLNDLQYKKATGTATEEDIKQIGALQSQVKGAADQVYKLNKIQEKTDKLDTQSRIDAAREARDKYVASIEKEIEQTKEMLDLQQERDIQQGNIKDDINAEIASQNRVIKAIQDKIALREKYGAAYKSEIADLKKELETEQYKGGTLQLKANIEAKNIADEAAKKLKEAQDRLNAANDKKYQLQVELGLVSEADQLNNLAAKIIKTRDEIAAINQKYEAGEFASVTEYLARKTELENQEMEQTKAFSSLKNKIIDADLAKKSKALEAESRIAEAAAEAQKKTWTNLIDDSYSRWIEASSGISNRRLDALDTDLQAELLKYEGNEAAKLKVQAKYDALKSKEIEKNAQAQAAFESAKAAEMLALQDENDAKKLERTIANKQAQYDAAVAKGDTDAAEALKKELDAMQKELEDKQDTMTALANAMQDNLTNALTNMFSGDSEGAKKGMKKTMGTIFGYLKRLLTAYVAEIVLTSPTFKSLAAVAGPLAPVVTGGFMALLTAGMNALMNPLFAQLTSFSSGGYVTEPTLAIVGDAASRNAGDNTEVILRSDQLAKVMGKVLTQYENRMSNTMAGLVAAITQERIVGVISGKDILLSSQRTQTAQDARVRVGKN